MALPYTLTPDFPRAVDNLIQDAAVSDSTLHSRAQCYLDVFSKLNSSHGSVHPGPAWAERIHKASPLSPPFTTPNLFSAMYEVADELGLVAGRRYVSTAVCVCGEHAARADADGATGGAGAQNFHSGRADEVRAALHHLASAWAAFLLWPFYAHGREDLVRERDDDLPEASGYETPTAESIARAQRRRLKQQVLARDDSLCFVSGALDSSAYTFERPLPPGVTRITSCRTVSIIPPKVFAPPDASEGRDVQSGQDIMFGVLKGFCGLDAALLAEQAQGPANTLLMNGSAEDAFGMLVWCLHPTETPDRYELKSYDPVYNNGIGLARPPVCTHVTFVDHSLSTSGHGVDLPDRALLRAHAALAGVLHRGGAVDAFRILRYAHDVPSGYGHRGSAYPASTGGAFWRSVVEYGGPEPSPTDVLVKLVSVALNPVDTFVQAQGIPGLVPGYPCVVVGFDGAGTVEVGAEVANVAKGDKVYVAPIFLAIYSLSDLRADRLVQGTFNTNNAHTTFQEYTLQPAKYVAKVPATVSLCLATVVNGIWGHEENSNSARLTPPWEEGGTTKYAGQAALILGGGTNVGQYGFSPIITTASPKNTALLKALGATHVLDRALPPDALRAALPATPITYVYDAFGRGRDAQRLGYSVLAPGGAFVSVIPFDDGALTDLVEESERKGVGKRIARTRASYTFPGNGGLGIEIFKRLTGWLGSGAIVVRPSLHMKHLTACYGGC
ncbi:hypothetical protein V8D89_006672 [Ganoderma adspersum]